MNQSAMTLLVVDDLVKAKSFYTHILGMTIIEEFQDGIKLMLGSHPVLLFEGESAGLDYQHGVSANSTLIIEVDCLNTKLAELRKLGLPILHKQPGENRWGIYAAFKDPSGIVHEFFQSHKG